jgi:hypothetical protein
MTYERAQTTVCRQIYRKINWFLSVSLFQPAALRRRF